MSYKEDLDRVTQEIEKLESKIKDENMVIETLYKQKEVLAAKAKEENKKVDEQKHTQLTQAKTKIQEEINRLIAKQTVLDEEIEKITPE